MTFKFHFIDFKFELKITEEIFGPNDLLMARGVCEENWF